MMVCFLTFPGHTVLSNGNTSQVPTGESSAIRRAWIMNPLNPSEPGSLFSVTKDNYKHISSLYVALHLRLYAFVGM